MAVENNVTIFYRKTDEVVKCTICGMNCSEPEESYGYTSLSASWAGVKEKHWVSECKFVDISEIKNINCNQETISLLTKKLNLARKYASPISLY